MSENGLNLKGSLQFELRNVPIEKEIKHKEVPKNDITIIIPN